MSFSSFDAQASLWKRLLVGFAEEVELDASGRLLISPELRKFASFDKEVMMVGQGSHFEIWSQEAWEKQLELLATGADKLPAGMENFACESGRTRARRAGLHLAVLQTEAVEALRIKADGTYVDATFGRGGHSREILARLGKSGRLIALDRDPAALAHAETMNDPRLTVFQSEFSRISGVVEEAGLAGVDGVLLDLGVSSPQLDTAARGFSFRFDGPLDMRMDTSRGITAAEWLAKASQQEIGEVIKRYGEERFAKQIAGAIVAARSSESVDRTRQLAQIVAEAVPSREPCQDPATRTFQAIRIHVNQELEELEIALPQCLEMLNPEGRLVVISFHSLEDRIVKHYLRTQASAGDLPARLPLRAAELPKPRVKLIGKPVYPSAEEVQKNPRARSAVMRVAERIAA